MAEIIPFNPTGPGATADEWAHFDVLLGLTADLLPVVSNANARVAPNSTMKDIGKTPSRYNGDRQVVGIANWTQLQSTPEQIARWAKDRDLGVCVQTRRVRALDVDVPDADQAAAIAAFIARHCHLPRRQRGNSAKFLLAFELPGDFTKRRVKTAHGMVEFLATGQQFIALGTHPSGARYEWAGGLPDEFPTLTAEQFETLWAALVAEFGVEDAVTSGASVKARKLADVVTNDPVAKHLLDAGWVKRAERDGRLHITCPFEAEHTSESSESATTYFPAHTGGYANGHFECLHAHCQHRSDDQFKEGVSYVDENLLSEFERIASGDAGREASASAVAGQPDGEDGPQDQDDAPQPISDGDRNPIKPTRFTVHPAHEFANRPAPEWIVKGVLPRAELAVVFGESGSGKSFWILDLAAAVARGTPWRDLPVKRGRVVYVAAEGAGGFRNRLKAYGQHNDVGLADLPIGVIADAPNLMEKADAIDISKAIVASGGADLVIIDTLAQSVPGANENSGEDMGKALAHCKGIHRATKALVVLIHHSGKDSSRGARGWSGLRAAADVEIEILRADDNRSATVTKLKDGQDGAEFGFKLDVDVVIGKDSDGEDITSCVVRHNVATGVGKKKRKLNENQEAVMQAFDDLEGVSDEVQFPRSDVAKQAAKYITTGDEASREDRAQRSIKQLAKRGEVLELADDRVARANG